MSSTLCEEYTTSNDYYVPEKAETSIDAHWNITWYPVFAVGARTIARAAAMRVATPQYVTCMWESDLSAKVDVRHVRGHANNVLHSAADSKRPRM